MFIFVIVSIPIRKGCLGELCCYSLAIFSCLIFHFGVIALFWFSQKEIFIIIYKYCINIYSINKQEVICLKITEVLILFQKSERKFQI